MLKKLTNKAKMSIAMTILIAELYLIGYISLYWNQPISSSQTTSTYPNDFATPLSGSDYSSIYSKITDTKTTETAESTSPTTTSTTITPPNNNQTDTTQTASDPYSYPDNILPTVRSGDDLLVLVNKQYQLPSAYAPSDLNYVSTTSIPANSSNYLLRQSTLTALQKLFNAAQSQGLTFTVTSAYRSYLTQQQTYNYWVNYNGGNTAAADTISARAGHSQHQLGTAVDLTCPEIGNALTTEFGNTAVGIWLAQNSWQYGFVISFPLGQEAVTGFNYEPWHFRYIGEQNSRAMHESGKILEVWLQEQN